MTYVIGGTGFAGILVVASTVVFIGCMPGGMDMDYDNGSNDGGINQLRPYLENVEERVDTHRTNVSTILATSQESGTTVQDTRTADLVTTDDTAQDTWDMLHDEWEDYGQDMDGLLDDLGESVTTVGNCGMMMGGMMFGSDEDATCPCEPYMETTEEEVDRYLETMQALIEEEDEQGLWDEMLEHMDEMGTHMDDMTTHMENTFGMGGGMMNGGGMMM